jgi:ubiquitin C-terminal hydrolase
VKCTSCGFCSNTYEPFLDLSLEIQGKVGSLEEALARFTAIETLDKANRCVPARLPRLRACLPAWDYCSRGEGPPSNEFLVVVDPLPVFLVCILCVCDRRWKCSSCAQLVCARKQLTVYCAPNVCTVQLKR